MTTFSKEEGKEELKIHHGSRRHRSQTTAGRQTQSQCQICCCLSRWWVSHFLHFKLTPTLRLSALRPLVSKFGNYSLAFTTSCWVQPSHFYDLKKQTINQKPRWLLCGRNLTSCFCFTLPTEAFLSIYCSCKKVSPGFPMTNVTTFLT